MNPTQECFNYCCLAPRGKVYTLNPDDCSLAFPCSANFLFVHLELFIICLSIANSSGSWSTSILQWLWHLRTSGALDSKWSDRDSGNVLNMEYNSLQCSVQPSSPSSRHPFSFFFFFIIRPSSQTQRLPRNPLISANVRTPVSNSACPSHAVQCPTKDTEQHSVIGDVCQSAFFLLFAFASALWAHSNSL